MITSRPVASRRQVSKAAHLRSAPGAVEARYSSSRFVLVPSDIQEIFSGNQ
jgi:hypothetical protein